MIQKFDFRNFLKTMLYINLKKKEMGRGLPYIGQTSYMRNYMIHKNLNKQKFKIFKISNIFLIFFYISKGII